jgi:hypothetical protein
MLAVSRRLRSVNSPQCRSRERLLAAVRPCAAILLLSLLVLLAAVPARGRPHDDLTD